MNSQLEDRPGKQQYTFTKDHVLAIQPLPYAELQTTSDSLYVRTDHEIYPTSSLGRLIASGIITKKSTVELKYSVGKKKQSAEYDEYQFHRPLRDERVYDGEYPDDNDPGYETNLNENDCLQFSECINVANQTGDTALMDRMLALNDGPSAYYAAHAATDKNMFGVSNAKNIRLLSTIPETAKNNYAAPDDGQSYAIVRRKHVDKRSDYHIAFVVYQHNGVNVTLEAEADNKDNYMPKFCLYDTNPLGKTFHKRWSAEEYKNSTDTDDQKRYEALYNNGDTIVLNTRDVNLVLQEMAPKKTLGKTLGKTVRKSSKPSVTRSKVAKASIRKSSVAKASKVAKASVAKASRATKHRLYSLTIHK